MYTPVFPDYDNSILNITATLQNHYGCRARYAPLADLSAAMAAKRDVVLLIFDGLGDDILRAALPGSSFLRRHTLRTLTSVFPSTTTAALTSLYSGLSPIEHGWLGWSLFFREYGAAIDVLPNRYSVTKQPVGGKVGAGWRVMPYKTLYAQIDEATGGGVATHTVMPANLTAPHAPNIHHRADTLDDWCEAIGFACARSGQKFVLGYWPQLDSIAHADGCYAKTTRALCQKIDAAIQKLATSLNDTLIIVTADHGLLDITDDWFLNDMPQLADCLILPPTIEARALGFSVRSDLLETFAGYFTARFGGRYLLLSRDEVLARQLLGRGTPHKKSLDFIGDYLACALDTSMLRYRVRGAMPPRTYKGLHAGLDAREMLVPLIVIDS